MRTRWVGTAEGWGGRRAMHGHRRRYNPRCLWKACQMDLNASVTWKLVVSLYFLQERKGYSWIGEQDVLRRVV